MSDIALLVAEEFEKRKSLMKRGDLEKEMVGFDCLASSTLSKLSRKVGEEITFFKEMAAKEIEMVRSVMEPRSNFGLAVFDGFFSA